MGQFSVEKPVAPGSVLSGNQHDITGGLSERAKSTPFVLFKIGRVYEREARESGL
jgi:hypothetical protein